jgi:hypothetical protein
MRAAIQANVAAARRAPTGARSVAILLLAGCLTGAVVGRASLAAWADALPEGPAAAVIQSVAHGWADAIAIAPLPDICTRLHDAARAAEALRFAQQPGTP